MMGETVVCLIGSLIDLSINQLFSPEGSLRVKPKGVAYPSKATPIMKNV